MTEPLDITFATSADAPELATFAAKSFCDTFAHLYVPEELTDYLIENYQPSYFTDAMERGDTVLVSRQNGLIVAYAKVGEILLPVENPPKGSQEIHRLYIDKSLHGLGMGRRYMDRIMSLPNMIAAPMVYLCVWEENVKALGLYGSYGFSQIGTYLYRVGSRADNDLILARKASG